MYSTVIDICDIPHHIFGVFPKALQDYIESVKTMSPSGECMLVMTSAYFKQLIVESTAVPYEKITHIISENDGSDVMYIFPKIRNELITIRYE